jgi:hypothetical protein
VINSGSGIGTASWLEIVFIAVALCGIARAAGGLARWRREDRRRAAEGVNGRLKVLYRGKVRLYLLCIAKMAIYLTLAVQAALLPTFGTPLATFTPFQRFLARLTPYTGSTLLTISALLLVLIPEFEERDRGHMLEQDAAEMAEDVRRAWEE